jgi:diadenylate cyclase
MDKHQQYIEDLNRYMDNIQEQLNKLNSVLKQEDCCILSDFDLLQKSVSEAQNIAAAYYLQSYLSPYTNQYVNLSLAAQHLSEKNHGALIAIERDDEVDAYIHNGTPINANISHVLLETIFYPGNPLHDGGVVIKGEQIHSAGNIFPLTDVTFKNRKFGTRHRAAIGLSEKTDAIVLVISEETGRISFARNGNLYIVRA